MTLETIFLLLGLSQTVIDAIAGLTDIQQEVTPAMMADIKAKMADAEEGWAQA